MNAGCFFGVPHQTLKLQEQGQPSDTIASSWHSCVTVAAVTAVKDSQKTKVCYHIIVGFQGL
jgi:hypothetical protein